MRYLQTHFPTLVRIIKRLVGFYSMRYELIIVATSHVSLGSCYTTISLRIIQAILTNAERRWCNERKLTMYTVYHIVVYLSIVLYYSFVKLTKPSFYIHIYSNKSITKLIKVQSSLTLDKPFHTGFL